MSVNNPNTTIHESVVKDVVDLVTSVKDFDEVQFLRNIETGRSFKSISSATKDMILTFPVLCCSDISIEAASMISKALERKYAAMLQMLFSAIDIRSNENVIQYLQRFHANLGPLDGYLDQYIASVDKLITTYDENWEETEIPREVQNEVLEYMKQNCSYTLPDSINENSLADYKVEKKSNGKFDVFLVQEGGGNLSNFLNITGTAAKAYADYNKGIEAEVGVHQKTLLPNDVKKANELMPTLMVVRFNQYQDTDGTCKVLASKTCVIGVKCKLYPIEFTDIAYRISNKTKEKNFLNNLIRATTNEISFVRDFMFAVDKAKMDAKSYGMKGSSNKMWKVLERRSIKSKIRRSMKMDNDATAISTLVLSQNLVDYLKKTENLSLEKTNTCRLLMESYNLMSIVIVDETMEVAKFLFDTGEDDFEVISFNNLERESSDGSYRKVVNLLSKKM
ncbi:MAG: hypothetical protein IJ889_00395 [Eubacterium sp.]|nr:hypothetical protein [Eubacterium sp.]MBR2247265.1 hypothetical protein [Bacilli bacterium]